MQNHFTKYFPAVALCLASFLSARPVHAQSPGFANNTTGRPEANEVGKKEQNATVIYANSDGGNQKNEFIYFKVYAPGGGSNSSNYDWYSNPTAWMDPYNFHFYNANLLMYKNLIQLQKGGAIEFGSDQAKEPNAGKIAYQAWGPGLNIVGGNTVVGSKSKLDRKLTVFAEGGTLFSGGVTITGPDDSSFITPQKLNNGADLSSYKLFVNGGVLAKEVRVNANWADYVFKADYRLQSLAEVERHIQQHGHLPGMPSAKEVEADGLSVGEIVRLQQEKIEELTLHLIALRKEMDQWKQTATSSK